MKSSVLLVWLALFGDPNALPSGLAEGFSARTIPSAIWVGEWLVHGDRRPISATVMAVRGREQLAGKLTFGQGASAVVEHWIGRPEGRWLRLTRAGVGDGRVSVTDTGRLVGRLSRLDAVGEVNLSPLP
jgi:hypothetical protein